ncbi:NAD(P)H-binding protein [Ligilactobacillus salivarius]|uniref:NAD(P)H-binding protein n=1 Tax=Ligilactobacillus salivarius TaxID=1624 RepID=UPI0009DA32DE|nr:NAD(P)H-binding protein [Ligilactobacillus salivarius]OQR11836.1 oxidoreductase [Ligilactobacillus salivarius]
MAKKILILGAAGEIARMLTDRLLAESDAELVSYGRNVSQRLALEENNRIKLVDGTFGESEKLEAALADVDAVYLNSMSSPADTASVVQALEKAGVKRLLGATIAGVEDEVPYELATWTKNSLPASYIKGENDSAKLVKDSNLDYTLLRLTWLFNDESDREYELVPSGVEFADAEVSRQAVTQAILDILNGEESEYVRKSFGLGKPNTHYGKPSFY